MNLIYHHLGLGDHIICNGLVRSVVELLGEVCVFTKQTNLKLVRRMYEDSPQIKILEIPDHCNPTHYVNIYAKQNFANLLQCGFDQLYQMQNLNFDEVFYACARVPFNQRWDKFKIIRNYEKEQKVIKDLNPEEEPYIFVHDDSERGFILDVANPNNYKIIKNNINVCPFDMIGLLEKAQEIHCMESSFKCLVDSITSINCPLYFYKKIRENPHGITHISKTRKNWVII